MPTTKYVIKYANNANKINNSGGGLFDILSCSRYYNDESYCFNNFADLKRFLINVSGKPSNGDTLKNWPNGLNTESNYKGTILDELIKIDFNMARFLELPQLVQLLLNIKPKPSHLLEFLIPKETFEYCKNIIMVTENNPNPYLRSIIQNAIDPKVLTSIQEILGLLPQEANLNSWDALTKLLEFISCLCDSTILLGILAKIKIDLINSTKEILKNQPIQIVLLDDILYKPNSRVIKNIYTGAVTKQNISNSYSNFVLRDFFDPSKNTNFVLPPSALLLLSIKLNDIINIKGNYYNDLFRYLLQNSGYQCDYRAQTTNETEINNYLESQQIRLEPTDSNLIDSALIQIVNGNSTNEEEQSKKSLLNEIGKNYKNMISSVKNLVGQNKTLSSAFDSVSNLLTINTDKEKRIQFLEGRITHYNSKIANLNAEKRTASTTKRFGSSDADKIQEKIKAQITKLNTVQVELDSLKQSKSMSQAALAAKDAKLNLILKNILLLVGLGLEKIDVDLCTLSGVSGNINWRTFDKLLKIFDGKIFKFINFSSSKTLTNLILQYVAPYTTYLPFDIKTFLYSKLKLDTPQKIQAFNNLYNAYETKLYQDFIHDDGFYYSELNDNGSKNNYALFPPSKLLNEIKNEVI